MNTEKNIISVNKVCKTFKDVKAVRDVSFTIGRGEFVALLGPNGAGKTTLVEMIEGIQKNDCGEILINGKPWQSHSHEHHRIMGISLQETRFTEKLSVEETMNVFASFYNLGKTRVDEVIDETGLNEKRKSFVVNLSGGQRQKLALGIALLNKPEILLLDEPTTGLDPNARRELWALLMDLKNKGNTSMILTTHYMEEAEYLCDRIIILDHGTVLAEGTLDQLLSYNQSNEVIEFDSSDRRKIVKIPLSPALIRYEYDDKIGKGKAFVTRIMDYLPVLLEYAKVEKIELQALECRRMTLDDVFVMMTGRRLAE